MDTGQDCFALKKLALLKGGFRGSGEQTTLLLLSLLLTGCAGPPKIKTAAPVAGAQGYNRADLLPAKANPVGAQPAAVVRERVVWLGIATTIADLEVTQRFPILSRAEGQNGSLGSVLTTLDRRIQTGLANHGPFPGFELVQQTGEQRPSDLGMALLLNKERFREEHLFEGTYRSEYGILGQLVFIDQQKQEICGSIPIGQRRWVNTTETPYTRDQLGTIARQALLGNGATAINDDSILGQIFKELEKAQLSIRSDYCFEVGTVSIDAQCLTPAILDPTIKPVSFGPSDLSMWEGEVGPLFAAHLANSAGLILNPYVAKSGGKDNILALQFLKGASRVVEADGKLSLRLRPPVRRFDIAISKLTCGLDAQWSGKYVVNLIFGFTGTISVVEPVTGRTVIDHGFDVSLEGFKTLPRELRDTYWKNARRKLLPDQFEKGDYDQKWCWQNSLENFLDQITSEMLFDKGDAGRRFSGLRSDLARITHALGKSNPELTRR